MNATTAKGDATRSLTRRELLRESVLVTAAVAIGDQPTARGGPRQEQRSPVSIVPEPSPVKAGDGYIEVDGARLYYWDTGGTGQPLVLLHPGTGSAESWAYQQPVFARAGYRLIAYSRRGFWRSESTAAADASNVSGSPDVEDLSRLATQLQLGRFHLLGCAAGGFLAAAFAVSQPESLRSLIIAGSIMNVDDREYQALLERVLPPNFNTMPSDFRELGPSYRALNPAGTARWLEIEHRARTAAAMPRQMPPPGAGARVPVTFAALNQVALRAPTLLVTGDIDLYMSPGVLQFIAARMPAAQTALIDNAGHAAFWEQPAQFNATLLAFLKRVRR
jgi:pimeloyl-ACP methyl ester carboxylesterase